MVQAVESPLVSPTSCADATCGKGSPAPAAPSPAVVLAGVLAALAVTAAAAARVRRRPAWVGALPRGLPRPALPPSSVLLAQSSADCARPDPSILERRCAPPGAGPCPRPAAAHRRPPHHYRRARPVPHWTFKENPPCRSPIPGPRGPQSSRSSKSTTSARSGTSGRREVRRPGTRAESFRLRHPVMTALIPVGLVVAAIATMVVIKATGGSASLSSSHLSAAGTSRLGRLGPPRCRPRSPAASPFRGRPSRRWAAPGATVCPLLSAGPPSSKDEDGKPTVTYVGAEYCPYCAAERWALAVALSRFGTFTHLSATHSAGTDVYPTPRRCRSMGRATRAPIVDFQPVEEATNQVVNGSYETLQTPPPPRARSLNKYDAAGSIPFPRHRQQVRRGRGQLLATGVAGPDAWTRSRRS